SKRVARSKKTVGAEGADGRTRRLWLKTRNNFGSGPAGLGRIESLRGVQVDGAANSCIAILHLGRASPTCSFGSGTEGIHLMAAEPINGQCGPFNSGYPHWAGSGHVRIGKHQHAI